jgi:hypothetical protein
MLIAERELDPAALDRLAEIRVPTLVLVGSLVAAIGDFINLATTGSVRASTASSLSTIASSLPWKLSCRSGRAHWTAHRPAAAASTTSAGPSCRTDPTPVDLGARLRAKIA